MFIFVREAIPMLVSTKGRYALRVMLELAQSDSTVYMPLPLIAEKQGISEKYLESIISVLSKAGLVDGLRGKGGGYRLNRPAADYSVGQILRLTEGSLAPVTCLESEENPCPRAGQCTTLPMWEKLDALWPTCWLRPTASASDAHPHGTPSASSRSQGTASSTSRRRIIPPVGTDNSVRPHRTLQIECSHKNSRTIRFGSFLFVILSSSYRS